MEVDTLDIRPIPGVVLKHFTAQDVVRRWDVVGVHTSLGRALKGWEGIYNTARPHQALDGRTPAEYLGLCHPGVAQLPQLSHM